MATTVYELRKIRKLVGRDGGADARHVPACRGATSQLVNEENWLRVHEWAGVNKVAAC